MLSYRLALRCVLAIVIAIVPALRIASATLSANLTGIVYSEATNQRLAHASVWLCDDGGTRLLEAITTDAGQFSFTGLHAGPYILKVTSAGYDPVEMDVDVSFGTEHGISVFLKPARKSLKDDPGGALISAHELSMPKTARKFADSGKKKLYADKNPAAALQDLQAAVKNAPDYYEAYYQMGMVFLALQNSAEAENSLEKAVELSHQNFGDADLALALLWLARHDTARGEPLLRRGLELNPNSWTGFFELGKLELYRNHLEAALEAAERARTLAPDQAMVYRLLSLVHMRLKNDVATLADLDAYLRLDPESAEAATAKRIRADTAARLEKLQAAPVAAQAPQ
jgi:Flp pilus assembly protein TadD